MALNASSPLERAAAAARAEEPDDWQSVSESVKRRVRATVVPARPVSVVAADGSVLHDEHGSRTWVSSRVVRARLRDALRTGPDLAAERIDLTIGDDDLLTGVAVDVVCAYGTDLHAAAAATRELVLAVLADLLGAGVSAPVDVTVSDVVVGDVRVT